jgi:predicted kinase
MATLHFIAGKAGAGKTTLARRLASELPAVLVCEDEWLTHLAESIATLDDYLASARRVRRVLTPLVADILRCGTSVVMDFGGNTSRDRQWVRTIFESAGAAHVLHYIQADDATCLARVHERNERRPTGIYFGHVSDSQIAEVNHHFVPPDETERFTVVIHDAPVDPSNSNFQRSAT